MTIKILIVIQFVHFHLRQRREMEQDMTTQTKLCSSALSTGTRRTNIWTSLTDHWVFLPHLTCSMSRRPGIRNRRQRPDSCALDDVCLSVTNHRPAVDKISICSQSYSMCRENNIKCNSLYRLFRSSNKVFYVVTLTVLSVCIWTVCGYILPPYLGCF